MEPPIDRRYEIGVLLVHGIGEQQKGETLLEAGSAIVDVVRARLDWLAPSRHGPLRSAPRVSLASVSLYRDDPSELARAEVEIDGIEGLRRHAEPVTTPSRWLLAESWWAETFPPPQYLSVFAWVVNILPGTIVTHFDRRLRRTLFEIGNPDNLASPAFKYVRLVRDIVSLLAAMLLVPPLLTALTLALLIGFLPVPFAETIARTLQRVIAAIVGDSYALLGNELLAGAIVNRVRRDIQWLAARCRHVVVVAHSQGAAIAHMAVRQDPLTECEMLITYGSGLHKLTLVQQMRQQGTALVWLAVLLLLAATLTGLAPVVTGLASTTAPAVAALLAMAALAALATWLHAGRHSFSRQQQENVDRELYERVFRLRNERIEWADVYASDDPVANGPLLDEFVPPRGLSTHVTHNLGSPIRDHTSYWRNRDDFVSRLARVLLLKAGIDVGRDTDYRFREQVAKHRRRWRVSWRRAGLWVSATAVGCVAVRLWTEPPGVAAAAYRVAEYAARRVPFAGDWLAPSDVMFFHSPVGALLLGTLFGGTWWALNAAWAAWDRAEMSAFFRRAAFTNRAAWALTYWTALLTVLLAGTAALFGSVVVLVAAAVALMAAATALSDRLAHTQIWENVRARAASGALPDVGERWRKLDERALHRHIERGRRRAIFEMGRRQIASDDAAQRALGTVALERALTMGLREAGWWLGNHLEEQGDLDGARLAYEGGRKLGDSFAAYSLGILLSQKLNQPGEGLVVLRDAAFQMNEPLAAHSLALMLRHPGRRVAARRALRHGVALGDPLSMEWLGDDYRDAANDRAERRAHRSARVLRAAAVNCYRQAIEFGSASAALHLGRLLRDGQQAADAIEAFQAGVRLGDDACAQALGDLLLREGRESEAERAFHQAVDFSRLRRVDQPAGDRRTRPGVQSAWQLGQMLEARGSFDEAERWYRFAAGPPGEEAGVPEAAVRLGQRLDARGGRHEAVKLWERAVELKSIEAHVLLAREAGDRGSDNRALELLRAADVALEEDFQLEDGERARLGVAVGDAFRSHRDDDAAMVAYRRATSRMSHGGAAATEAADRLVQLVTSRSDLEQARRLADESWRIRSTDAQLTLARFLLAEGDTELAASLLASVRPAPADEMPYARLLEATGRTSRALDMYERAMERGSAEGARRLVALLEAGGPSPRLARARNYVQLLSAAPGEEPMVT